MITGRQIRAARGLLGWDASALAEKANLSRETISNIENGAVQARGSTLNEIARVLDDRGIEFIGDRGVAIRDETVRILEGDDAYLRLLDEVFHVCHGNSNASASFFFVDNSKSIPEVVAAHKRLRESGILCRYICQENPSRLDFVPQDYRAIPEKYYYNAVQVAYGDFVAHGYNEKPQRIMVIKSKALAESARRLFEMLWTTLPIPKIGEHE